METTELYMKVRLALQMMEVEKELHTETADGTIDRISGFREGMDRAMEILENCLEVKER